MQDSCQYISNTPFSNRNCSLLEHILPPFALCVLWKQSYLIKMQNMIYLLKSLFSAWWCELFLKKWWSFLVAVVYEHVWSFINVWLNRDSAAWTLTRPWNYSINLIFSHSVGSLAKTARCCMFWWRTCKIWIQFCCFFHVVYYFTCKLLSFFSIFCK